MHRVSRRLVIAMLGALLPLTLGGQAIATAAAASPPTTGAAAPLSQADVTRLAAGAGTAAPSILQQVCPSDPAQPLLEPEALQVMNAEQQTGAGIPAAHDLVDGTGVKVALIADGLDINNPDLSRGSKGATSIV